MPITALPTFQAQQQAPLATIADVIGQVSTEQEEKRRRAMQEQIQAQLIPLQIATQQANLAKIQSDTPANRIKEALALQAVQGKDPGRVVADIIGAPAEAGGKAITAGTLTPGEQAAFDLELPIPNPVDIQARQKQQEAEAVARQRAKKELDFEFDQRKPISVSPGTTFGTPEDIINKSATLIPKQPVKTAPIAITNGETTRFTDQEGVLPEGFWIVGHEPKDKSEKQVLKQDAVGNFFTFADGELKQVKTPEGFVTKGASEKPLNESQTNARSFGSRMIQAEAVFEDLEKEGFKPEALDISPGALISKGPLGSILPESMQTKSRRSVLGSILSSIPFVDIDPNFLKSKEFQRFEQATKNFVNATLRKESGAAIAESEMKNAVEQYIPVPGDDPQTKAQKKLNRQLASHVMLKNSGLDENEIDVMLQKMKEEAGAISGGSGSKTIGTAESYLSKFK